jgi:Fibronectin type III domain
MRQFLFFHLSRVLAVVAGSPLVLFADHAIAASTTPKYVQGNYAVPQTPETTVTVPYAAAQTAGNLNVVIVGWDDSTTHVSSVKDSKGHLYQLAVGPMVTGTFSQAVYYLKNISAAEAATNSVTVTFTAATKYPDIRILEYSGINPANPVDTVVGGTGYSATSGSGAVTTTNATDLLVAANMVQTTTISAGSGFTKRLLTNPDSDIAEDEVVTTTGSHSASAPLNSAGSWVMQMVAFRAASSATPTPTPKPTPTPTPAAIAYVQGNYAEHQVPQTPCTVPYTATQVAGDLNVVVVGWDDAAATVSSVTDTKGNGYHLAVGPTRQSGTASQSIYYAAKIAAAGAGTNAVKVSFSKAPNFPEIRILEYRGINQVTPVDVVAASTGNSTTSSSGAVTTTNAADLLVGANYVQTSSTGPGSGFTRRMLTSPDGDIAEDRIVAAKGSYSATAPLVATGWWVAQMVAFRGGSSSATSTSGATQTPTPGATPTPTPDATPTPTPTSSITLDWNPVAPTSNSATNPAGYELHYGPSSGNYTHVSNVGNTTGAIVTNLVSGSTYYFSVTAYNSAGVQSRNSNEVSVKAP